jgi:SSS family solute:Na+ symporter
MSTVSTSINSGSTVFLTDYYKRYVKGEVGEKQSMRVLYVASFVISVIGIGIGVLLINVESALDAWWKLAGVFSGGMLGLFLLGAFVKVVNVKATVIGVIIGLIVIFWMSVTPMMWTEEPMQRYASPFHGYLTVVIGTLIIFLVGFLGSLFMQKKENAH